MLGVVLRAEQAALLGGTNSAMIERFGGCGSAAKARAIASTSATPEALSTAPW